MKFSSTLNISLHQMTQSNISKSMSPHSIALFSSNNIKTLINQHIDTLSHISIDSLGLYLSKIFVEFSLIPVPPTMAEGKSNVQINGVQIFGRCI